MTWVAWRVQRLQYLAATGALATLAVWLVASGLDGQAHWSQISDTGGVAVLYALPGLLGLALGAPLVAFEAERGTNRTAWTQSITRDRWLTGKLVIGALVSGGLIAVLTPLFGWWIGATRSGPDIVPRNFGITGVAAVGYVLFAFLLGAVLGAVIRRPGWAFAAGVPIFTAVRLLIDALRPGLVPPAIASYPAQPATEPGGWVLNGAYLPLGRTTPAPGQTWASPWHRMGSCFYRAQSQAALERCSARDHLHFVFEYQPESHYWALQGAETAVYAVLALALAAATVAAVRRWQG
jgi:ABC-2 family transporter protein